MPRWSEKRRKKIENAKKKLKKKNENKTLFGFFLFFFLSLSFLVRDGKGTLSAQARRQRAQGSTGERERARRPLLEMDRRRKKTDASMLSFKTSKTGTRRPLQRPPPATKGRNGQAPSIAAQPARCQGEISVRESEENSTTFLTARFDLFDVRSSHPSVSSITTRNKTARDGEEASIDPGGQGEENERSKEAARDENDGNKGSISAVGAAADAAADVDLSSTSSPPDPEKASRSRSRSRRRRQENVRR